MAAAYSANKEDGYLYVVYSTVFCVVMQVLIRQAALLAMGRDHPKRGVAPRIATKAVSVVLNTVLVAGSIDRLLNPVPAVLADPIYGFSPHSQWLFSAAGGYFLWATCASLFYKGSVIAVVQNGVQCGICLLALHPFLHRVGNIFLLTQASNLVLDMYACSALLGRKSYAFLFPRVIHPWVFFIVRIGIALPMSGFFLVDMVALLQSGEAHDRCVVGFCLMANALMNVLNVYWFVAMLIEQRGIGQVISEAQGGQIVGAKWFAFNLNWFDVGVTMSFGEAAPSPPTLCLMDALSQTQPVLF